MLTGLIISDAKKIINLLKSLSHFKRGADIGSAVGFTASFQNRVWCSGMIYLFFKLLIEVASFIKFFEPLLF